jgi:hypothetical protein
LSAPLVFVPIWNRSWRQGAILGVWLVANPLVFPEPKDDKAWATPAMLGEEMWIAKRPLDRAMALGVGALVPDLKKPFGVLRTATPQQHALSSQNDHIDKHPFRHAQRSRRCP